MRQYGVLYKLLLFKLKTSDSYAIANGRIESIANGSVWKDRIKIDYVGNDGLRKLIANY